MELINICPVEKFPKQKSQSTISVFLNSKYWEKLNSLLNFKVFQYFQDHRSNSPVCSVDIRTTVVVRTRKVKDGLQESGEMVREGLWIFS